MIWKTKIIWNLSVIIFDRKHGWLSEWENSQESWIRDLTSSFLLLIKWNMCKVLRKLRSVKYIFYLFCSYKVLIRFDFKMFRSNQQSPAITSHYQSTVFCIWESWTLIQLLTELKIPSSLSHSLRKRRWEVSWARWAWTKYSAREKRST